MTRLIDADALNEKLCKTTIFIKDGEVFQRMINDAPTIELDGDTISRRAAILAITGEPPEARYPSWYAERIKALPSAETPTVLEKHQLSEETPTNTPTDLISKAKVLEAYADLYALDERLLNFREELDEVYDNINALPSAPDSRQHGEWVEIEDYNGDIHYQCDQCGNEFILIDGTPKDNNYHFCPNCGARMYKGGEDE